MLSHNLDMENGISYFETILFTSLVYLFIF